MSEVNLSPKEDSSAKNSRKSRFLERLRRRGPTLTSNEAESSATSSNSIAPSMSASDNVASYSSNIATSAVHPTIAPASTNSNNQTIPISSVQSSIPPAILSCDSGVTPRDLWSEAFDKLSYDDQEEIRKLQPTLTKQPLSKKDVDDLLGQTKMVQQNIKANSMRFRFRGKDIIVRDVVGKIVFWLSKFKEVGDIAVNFDPVHASLPWAGIRFLLQAAIGEREQMGDLVVAVERLSCLIHRSSIYQRLYHSGNVSLDVLNALHYAMVRLHTAMLHLMSLSHRLLAKNTGKRATHALFHPEELAGLLDTCEKLEAQVEREAHNCERARSQKANAESKSLLAILQEPVLRTDEHVLTLLEIITQRERLEILDWTSNVLYGANHQTVCDKRIKDTCEWLIDHTLYRKWQDTSASTILWLCGNPGAGKTYLTSKVIDEVRADLDSGLNHEGFAFFYCNRNEDDRRKPLSVLRAFVRQLSTISNNETSIQRGLKQIYNESRLKASQLTMNDCKGLILEYVNIYPRTTLVLDALDECEKHSRLELMEAFDNIVAKSSNPIRIFISSRPDLDIKKKFKDRSNIYIDAKDSHHDISTFVKNEISRHYSWHDMTSQLQEHIVTSLQERSQGMFQWAFLQIKQLLDLDLEDDILERLGKLPDDLKKAYDEIYNSMNPAEKRIADRAFQWVMCACHPLATDELLPAICQDGDSDDLRPLGGLSEDLVLKCCHNLLIIDPVRKVWIPSHLSVIEYLENHICKQTQASCLAAKVCLLVLLNTTSYNRENNWKYVHDKGKHDSELPESAQKELATREKSAKDLRDPLHQPSFARLSYYARHHWPIHVQKSDRCETDTSLSTRLQDFLGFPTDSSAAYRCWGNMTDSEDYFLESASPPDSSFLSDFHLQNLRPYSIASLAYCTFGLSEFLPGWSDFTWVPESHSTKDRESYLELAAACGSISTCKNLIENGAEVNAQTRSGAGSALAHAALRSRKEIVEFLVEQGADVNMQLKYGTYGSALAVAVYRGSNEMVELLIKQGAEVNMQLQYGNFGSALAVTGYRGRNEMVELLIKEGADVNMQLQYGRFGNALAIAAYGGRNEIVKFLINNGAEVDMQLQYGKFGSALAVAAYYGENEMVELLIKQGAEVNMQLQTGDYGSALSAAASFPYGDRGAVIKILVEGGGADVNMLLQHGKYATALEAAVCAGNTDEVELLVKYGAKRREPERRLPNQEGNNTELKREEKSESEEEQDSFQEPQSGEQNLLGDQATIILSQVATSE